MSAWRRASTCRQLAPSGMQRAPVSGAARAVSQNLPTLHRRCLSPNRFHSPTQGCNACPPLAPNTVPLPASCGTLHSGPFALTSPRLFCSQPLNHRPLPPVRPSFSLQSVQQRLPCFFGLGAASTPSAGAVACRPPALGQLLWLKSHALPPCRALPSLALPPPPPSLIFAQSQRNCQFYHRQRPVHDSLSSSVLPPVPRLPLPLPLSSRCSPSLPFSRVPSAHPQKNAFNQ